MNNYTIYHLHSDYSSCTTNIDSATKVDMYVEKAKECGMKAMAFSEHGNIFNWYYKKTKIEEAGMKYIHAVEAYITEDIEEKVRDNRHCVLIARNYSGFKELNRMITISNNRDDGHFYYVPRITMQELEATSDNIIVTTACMASPLNSDFKNRYLDFLITNKHRCFLEIQHHDTYDQTCFNSRLMEYHEEHGIPLIAGTDTHSLNEELAKARVVLQRAKNIYFENEDGWDLVFKTYDELITAYEIQNTLPMDIVIEAIENTNVLADMVEEFEIDKNPKYPKLYEDSEKVFKDKIYEGMESHPYATKNHKREDLILRIQEEFPVYQKTGVIDYMLFRKYIKDWEIENDIYSGPSRGSVSGSMIAYLLQITEMDSMKFDLNFFRFLNPDRVSNCDIDIDYYEPDRNKVREFLLTNENIETSEIITFHKIETKGSIREVARALEMDIKDADYISKNFERDEDKLRESYPELFHYVDLLSGVITHVGTHAAGVLCSDRNIVEEIGLVTSKDTPYPVSCLDMYGLDDCFWVKLDCLGLNNIGVINETCKLAGIDRINPDNIDLNDQAVWDDIRDDTTGIFQFESPHASKIIKDLFSEATLRSIREHNPDMPMIKLMSFANGLIRPSCNSFRNDAIKGIFYDNGLDELNQLLANEMGYVSMQETIMRFLVQFCGYSDAESDIVRKGIAKKTGTEKLLPEIKERFISYTNETYGVPIEKCEEIIEPFLVSILNASAYGFSWNHSDAYSCIGYECGYLRYYYPLEYLTTCLNIFSTEDKIGSITRYAGKKRIRILPIKFGKSKHEYFIDKENNSIYKGIGSIKYMNRSIAEELYALKDNKYEYFYQLLEDIDTKTTVNSRQLKILIDLDFFSDFGNINELNEINEMFIFFRSQTGNKYKANLNKEKIADSPFYDVIAEHSVDKGKNGSVLKSYKIIDIYGILRKLEDEIKSRNLDDLTMQDKVILQIEYMGYVTPTGNEADRKLLFVKEVYPAKTLKDDRLFGYNIITQSIGSGVEGRFTIFNSSWKRCGKLIKGDIIRLIDYKRKGQYFNIEKYSIEGTSG